MTLIVTDIQRITTTASGAQANDDSWEGRLSPDGTKLLFTSDASNLAGTDTNNTSDVFVKDLITGAVTLISGTTGGAAGNSNSGIGEFSPDGTKVLFYSASSDLVTGDVNGGWDVFIKDLTTGVTTLVSTNSEGEPANAGAYGAHFSPDGTRISFGSASWNLIEGDPNPGGGPFISQNYVKDLTTGEVTRITATPAGEPGNKHSEPGVWSPDGTKLAFYTYATNITPGGNTDNADIVIKDLVTGDFTIVSTNGSGELADMAWDPVFSPDGTKLAFLSDDADLTPNDTNNTQDIYIKDLVTGELTNISHTLAGVSFSGNSFHARFSPDGRYLAFGSDASNLVGGDNSNSDADIYVKDLLTGNISRVSTNILGEGGNDYTLFPSWSADGTRLIFSSDASNLVDGDTNGRHDIFIVTLEEDNTINGTSGDDTINGLDVAEVINGETGNDRIDANGGDDIVNAGVGNDVVFGGTGNDTISGNSGDDRLFGNENDDALLGGTGNDSLFGESGNDALSGGSGDDFLFGGEGNDLIKGNDGVDYVEGGNGDDEIQGNDGNDTIYGNAGHDNIHGGNDDDVIYGNGASDLLYGDAGDDLLYGGTGTNKLSGGTGKDGFVLNVDAFDGHPDTVSDFKLTDDDYLLLDNILVGFDALTDAITDFVTKTEGGGNTTIAIDRDGSGSAYTSTNVAILKSVTGLDIQDLYDNGHIVVNNGTVV